MGRESYSELTAILERQGYLNPGEQIEVEALGGGVSNHVLRVTTPRQRFIVKQSLPKLRVTMDRYADQGRIWHERDYLALVGEWFPGHVPAVLFSDEAHFLLAIAEVTDATLWKQTLMAGGCDPTTAANVGALLAKIHSRSFAKADVAERFQRRTPRSEDSFEQLRIDPYWRTIAQRHPDVAPAINAVIAALEAHPLALVHGDYSPKNIFVRHNGDVVLLDAEVAHWGDPTFDVAFCMNHFLLKAIYHGDAAGGNAAGGNDAGGNAGDDFVRGASIFWAQYQAIVTPTRLRASVADRLPGQLAALLLARVDGKSPVEYLVGDEPKQAHVRQIARNALLVYPQLTVEMLLTAVEHASRKQDAG